MPLSSHVWIPADDRASLSRFMGCDPVSDASVVVEKHVTACYRMEPKSTERLFMFEEESTGGSPNPSL